VKTTELIEIAARLKAEDGSLSCYGAYEKAAKALGLVNLPRDLSCEKLEEAVRDYQLLFRPGQAASIRRLREEALKAMRFLTGFRPRLVGSVLSGTADEQATLTLHLFADTPEEVMLFLMEQDIPFVESTRRHRYRDGSSRPHPVFSFVAGEQSVDLVVFESGEIREAPIGAGDSGPIQRVSIAQLEQMLEPEALP